MNRSDAPTKQPTPFAVNGPREPILPTTPAGDNTASYDSGFPPITMTLKSAGGLPPKGQDMNQILFELSSLSRWFSTGAINSYDSVFATSIGGYPKGAVVLGSDAQTRYISTTDNNLTNPNTGGAGWTNLSTAYLARSNPFGDIKADGTVNTAKINLGIQAFNSSGSTTTVSAPTSGVFFYVTDSGNWGVIDQVGNPLPLPIAGGGTGANTLLGARVNLGVSAFGSDSDRSTASSPNAAAYTFITNYGDWGASDSSGQIIPLSLGRGGTAATDAATARTNLGLKTAATRDVGVGSGQIPDMGSFQFSAVAKGYEKLPSGQIRQWGTISIPAANASTDFALDTFAIPFPNGVLNCRANGTATTTNTPCFATAEAISTTQIRLKAIAIDLSNKTITQGMAVTVSWEAIGA